jgi:NADH-quinone oxidoreductase subunit N
MSEDLAKLLGEKAAEWSQKYLKVSHLSDKEAPAGEGFYYDVSGGQGAWNGPFETQASAEHEGTRITNFKRLLGYSSIAHAGYLLVGLAAIGDAFAGRAVVFYLSGYFLMTFLAFLVMVPVTKATGGDDLSHFNGLARRSPGLALAMLIAAASLAGVPFTVGFFGKFFIFEAAMNQELYLLVLIGVITVASGFYYYFKVIRAMYWQPAPEGCGEVAVSPLSKLAIGLCTLLILVLGFYPQLLIRFLP